MDSHKISIKFFALSNTLPHGEIIQVFHSWIQQQALPGHLLIDVADYDHVYGGPGTVLVADEANIYLEHSNHRLGLRYVRKRPIANTTGLAATLSAVITEAQKALQLLESDPKIAGQLKFNGDEIVIAINDRLAAPNTAETFRELRPTVEKVIAKAFGTATAKIADYSGPADSLLEFTAHRS